MKDHYENDSYEDTPVTNNQTAEVVMDIQGEEKELLSELKKHSMHDEMLNELMSKVLKQHAKMVEIDEKITEAMELFKHGQKEMHRLISEGQTKRFSTPTGRPKKQNVKAYDKEDKRIFGEMAAAFSGKTGQASRIFSQQLNLECLRILGHNVGSHCNSKTTTGALEKLNADVVSGASGVPSFKRYFQLGLEYLESFKVDVSDEIKNHINTMTGDDSDVDSAENISDSDSSDLYGSYEKENNTINDLGVGEPLEEI